MMSIVVKGDVRRETKTNGHHGQLWHISTGVNRLMATCTVLTYLPNIIFMLILSCPVFMFCVFHSVGTNNVHVLV